jgi:hypothetical protein
VYSGVIHHCTENAFINQSAVKQSKKKKGEKNPDQYAKIW